MEEIKDAKCEEVGPRQRESSVKPALVLIPSVKTCLSHRWLRREKAENVLRRKARTIRRIAQESLRRADHLRNAR